MQFPLPTPKPPRSSPPQRLRPASASIPPTLEERARLRRLAEEYVAENRAIPPMPFAELRQHAEAFLRQHRLPEAFRDYAAVLISNEAWKEHLAAVPYQRRLLLLPKCLRHEEKCPAPFDEFGLLCRQCGLCSIQDLQEEAERLGYAVLVAEGSALVTSIIQTGRIDAIVGVSCLGVLEKAFPYMEAAAIPGIAVPLLQADCKNTNVDLDWVWDFIHLTSDDHTRRLDLEALRRQVDGWFSPEALAATLGPATGQTEELAHAWLAKAGKRWRPFLAACVFKSLQADPDAAIPDDFRRVAVAVECFHKASLIHDDIEDNDDLRYGQHALHVDFGTPVALNVGDLLIGEGYRLVAECAADAETRARMLRVAAEGHRALCLGQGAELAWFRDRRPLASAAVLEIFRQKTAPAFAVALQLGALYARRDEAILDVLGAYSAALGIAYQIRDDLEDFHGGTADLLAQRPTLPLALAHEKARGDAKAFLETLWRGASRPADHAARLTALLSELDVEPRARRLYHAYKEEAVRVLRKVDHPSLKGLLRRVIGKIFNDLELKGWCSEFEAQHAAGRPPGGPPPR